jgi:hypothetical protein
MKHVLFSRTALVVWLAGSVVGPSLVAQTQQNAYDTPDAAVTALINAAQSGDPNQLAAVLGVKMRDQFQTGEPALDQRDRREFLRNAQSGIKFEPAKVPGRMTVLLGSDEWPFPVPLVKTSAGWIFDSEEGRQEILDRRIGRNEIHAVETCLGYVEAQLEYARIDHKGDGILQFAQRLVSTPGTHDGLYWSDSNTAEVSPLGPIFASDAKVSATAPALSAQTMPRGHFGYEYRILTAQGPKAQGGARNFLLDGHLMGGFGLIAWPRSYGVTGVQTYIVNQLGQVYYKDLGPETPAAAAAITAFDPDSSWTRLPAQ